MNVHQMPHFFRTQRSPWHLLMDRIRCECTSRKAFLVEFERTLRDQITEAGEDPETLLASYEPVCLIEAMR